MTRDEFSVIWHDWLRGVTLVGAIGILVGLYFLKWIPHDVFAVLMGVAAIVGVLGFALEHCVCSLLPGWMRAVTLALVLCSGAGLLVAIHVGVTPGSTVAEGRLSPTHPVLEGYVPAGGDVLVNVTGTPGILASKDDTRIQAKLKAVYRNEENPDKDIEERMTWTFAASTETRRGMGTSATSFQAHLENAVPGKFEVRLEELIPKHATPLEVRASVAQFPSWALRIVLAALVVVALLLAPMSTRKGVFPTYLPGALVLGAAGFATLYGLPPASPEPKLLGFLVASAFGGAVVGYLMGKGVQKLFPSPMEMAERARAAKAGSPREKSKG